MLKTNLMPLSMFFDISHGRFLSSLRPSTKAAPAAKLTCIVHSSFATFFVRLPGGGAILAQIPHVHYQGHYAEQVGAHKQVHKTC